MAENTVKEKSRRRRKRQEEEPEEQEKGVTQSKGRATPGRRTRQRKETGGNIVTRTFRSINSYRKGVFDELAKVTWPTREELVRLAIIVAATLVASSVVLGLISFAFTELFILGFDNEIVFLGMFVVIILGFVVFTRMNRNSTPFK